MEMIAIIEECLGKKADYNFQGMQPGDVKESFADIEYSKNKLGFSPSTSIKSGIPKFIDWYKQFNNNQL